MRFGWFRPVSPISRGIVSVTSMLVVLSGGLVSYHIDVRTSPGQLSTTQLRGEPLGGFSSHAEFHQECSHCHVPMHCISTNRCQKCHIEVARERDEGIALHGLLPGTNKCQNCHTEHQGSDAVISALPFDNIDHEPISGFSLKLHQADYDGTALTCESCHVGGQFKAEEVDCTTCHVDADPALMAEHIDRFGEACHSCHDGHDRMIDFDHDQVYVLAGAHDDAECEDCHIERVYAGTPGDCVDCHEEPEVHAGQFGLDCSRCHTSEAWAPAELTRHDFHLDHGDEGEIDCEVCHVASYAEHTCYADCHDPEGTRAAHSETDTLDSAAYENCATCHPTGQAGG